VFIWPDKHAKDGATWTGSFNQNQWDSFLEAQKGKRGAAAKQKAAESVSDNVDEAAVEEAEQATEEPAPAKRASSRKGR
jgi:hypothetical protein